MSYRKARLSHAIRESISDSIAHHVSDPRVNSFTSVTRVELSEDLRAAHIFVSVMGADADSRTTMQGLQSARGMIQTRLARHINIRNCPIIRFHLDVGIKRAIETLRTLGGLKQEFSEECPDQNNPPERSIGPGES